MSAQPVVSNARADIVDSDIYCRLQGDQIVEYPVYGIHIRNRAHPVEWYTKVFFNAKPALPLFHSYQEKLEVFAGVPVASYTTIPMTYDQIIASLTPRDITAGPNATLVTLDIATLDAAQIQAIYKVVNNYFDDKMEALVLQRNYRSIESCLNYGDSAVEKYRTEAAFVKQLRDSFWPALEVYFDSVLAKKTDFPISIATIETAMPAIAWPAAR